MKSIRRSLLVSTGLALLLTLQLAAFGVWHLTSALLTDQFDQALRAKQLALLSEVDIEDEGPLRPVVDPDVAMAREFEPGTAGHPAQEFFQVWLGSATARSASLGDANLLPGPSSTRGPRSFDVELPGGRRGRAITTRQSFAEAKPDEPGESAKLEFELCYARERTDLDRLLWRLRLGGLLGAIALIVGISLLLWGYLGLGLRPLERLAKRVEAIEEPGKAPHFDDGKQPAELAPIARGLDTLLGHLAGLLERERRTSANIAHELRTPVAELLALSDPGDPPPDQTAARSRLAAISTIGHQMGRLIDALLALARLEAGAIEIEPTRFALRPMVEDTWAALELAGESAGGQAAAPRLVLEGDGDLYGDRDLFGVLVANLLSNARDYGAPETPIQVQIVSSPAGARLVIKNQAPGLEPADLQRFAEPFWRQNPARDDRRHAGLGLALCNRLAKRLGLVLDFKLEGDLVRAEVGVAGADNS